MTTTPEQRNETAAHAIVAVRLAFGQVRDALPVGDSMVTVVDLLEEGYIGMLVGATQTANALTDLRESMERGGIIPSDADEEQGRTGGL